MTGDAQGIVGGRVARILDALVFAALGWGALRLYAGGGVIGAVPGGEMTLALGLALVLALARRAVGGGAAGLFAPVIRRVVGEAPAPDEDAPPRRSLWAGMALVSMSVMLTELAITRLFSVILYYHFAFLAISLALLGLGFAGVLVYVLAPRFPAGRLHVQAAWLAIAAALSTVAAVVTILDAKISLEYSPENLVALLRIYLVSFVPLLLSGLVVTLLLTHRARSAGRLYFYDLVGAALAGPLLVPLCAWVGAPAAVLLAAATAALGGACLAGAGGYRRGVWIAGGLAAVLAAFAVVAPRSDALELRFAKGRAQKQVLFSRWNSHSRVAVYDRDHEVWGLSPRYKGPLPRSLWLDIDGSASTPITRVEGDPAAMPHFQAVLTAYAHALRPGGEALIIGAGGGRDLLSALSHGAARVDGVEINGLIADEVMRGRFREYSGDIYGHPKVQVHVDDGRSFIHRSERRFDVVQLSLVDTWAATSAGAYVLSENNLYTVEAFVDYLEHLRPEGILSVAHWPRGSMRALSLFVAARERLGLAEPARGVAILGHSNLVQMLFKRAAFTAEELASLRARARQDGFRVLYLPDEPGRSEYARLLADPAGTIAAAELDLSPTTDDRPFFFNFARLDQVPKVWSGSRLFFGDGLGNLLGALAITAAMAVLCFAAPMAVWALRRRGQAGARGVCGRRMLLYFACLGFGYIVVEIVLLQKLTLLLGHPTTSLVVSLAGMLAGSGLGAASVARVPGERAVSRARVSLALVIGVVALLGVGLYPLVISAISAALWPRVLVAFAVVLLAGFVMGAPLPLGIRILGRDEADRALIPWAWGVNGALSVFGSGAAIFLAMFFGFRAALLAGAAAYVLALLIALSIRATPR